MYDILTERLVVIAKMSRECERCYYPGVLELKLYSAGIIVNYGIEGLKCARIASCPNLAPLKESLLW